MCRAFQPLHIRFAVLALQCEGHPQQERLLHGIGVVAPAPSRWPLLGWNPMLDVDISVVIDSQAVEAGPSSFLLLKVFFLFFKDIFK